MNVILTDYRINVKCFVLNESQRIWCLFQFTTGFKQLNDSDFCRTLFIFIFYFLIWLWIFGKKTVLLHILKFFGTSGHVLKKKKKLLLIPMYLTFNCFIISKCVCWTHFWCFMMWIHIYLLSIENYLHKKSPTKIWII
jgi:hypothetical protein